MKRYGVALWAGVLPAVVLSHLVFNRVKEEFGTPGRRLDVVVDWGVTAQLASVFMPFVVGALVAGAMFGWCKARRPVRRETVLISLIAGGPVFVASLVFVFGLGAGYGLLYMDSWWHILRALLAMLLAPGAAGGLLVAIVFSATSATTSAILVAQKRRGD